MIDYASKDLKVSLLSLNLPPQAYTLGLKPRDIRSWVGPELRYLSCLNITAICTDCREQQSCPFALLYEPKVIATEAGPSTPPPPWAIRRFLADKQNTLEIILMGSIDRYAKIICLAVTSAFIRNTSLMTRPSPRDILSGKQQSHFIRRTTLCSYIRRRTSMLEGKSLMVKLLSPLRFEKDDIPIDDLDMAEIFRSALRRTRLLLGFFGFDAKQHGIGDFIEKDYKDIDIGRVVSKIGAFIDDKRTSKRQRRLVPSGGVAGQIFLKDPSPDAIKVLVCAELLSVGKMTTNGMGAISLEGVTI